MRVVAMLWGFGGSGTIIYFITHGNDNAFCWMCLGITLACGIYSLASLVKDP